MIEKTIYTNPSIDNRIMQAQDRTTKAGKAPVVKKTTNLLFSKWLR
jgi:hypothetical protein